MIRRVALVGLTSALLLLGGTGTTHAQAPEDGPTLESNRTFADFGDRVIVSGADWPANSIVQVQTCGNLALNGTSDCDQTTTVQAGVSTAGTFAAIMLAGNPPVPCPCVFRASSVDSDLVRTVEITLRGAATGEPTADTPPERRLAVSEARLEGSGPWTAYFGGRPERTLTFTVTNVGFVPIESPEVVLAVGKGDDPTGFVAPPEIPDLEPGESATVETDVDLPVLAIGTYAVVGSIPGFDPPVEFRAETSHIPWGMFLLLALAVLVLGVVLGRRFSSRRRSRGDETEPPDPSETVTPPDEPDESGSAVDDRDDTDGSTPGDDPEATETVDPTGTTFSRRGADWGRGRTRLAR